MDSSTQIFVLTLVSMSLAFLGMFLRQIFKQRCDSISCLGCSIHRDVALENHENELRIERGVEISSRGPIPENDLRNVEER